MKVKHYNISFCLNHTFLDMTVLYWMTVENMNPLEGSSRTSYLCEEAHVKWISF